MYVDLKNKGTKNTKFVGWCRLHRGYLTAKQLKTKKCLSKGCRHLIKLEHTWWVNRQVLKKKKKEHKKKLQGGGIDAN